MKQPVELEELREAILGWRAASEKIVLTSGVFDLVHLGHIDTLYKAKLFGDRLIVAIDSDESVKRKKGSRRPIRNFKDRAALIANLRFVDAVTRHEEVSGQPLSLINTIQPDTFVKAAGEWSKESLIFTDAVASYGGKFEVVPHRPGYSTSLIIERVLAAYR